MRKAAAGALLLASTLCAGTASAQGSAQVSVSDFSWALVDLDPNDGITPSLIFLAPQQEQPSSGTIGIDAGGMPVGDARQGEASFAPLSLAAGNAWGSASGTVSGGDAFSFSMTSDASLTSNGSPSTLSNELSSGYLGFVLSPMTAVTFSSRVMLSLGLELPAPLTAGSVSAQVRFDVNADTGGFGDNLNQFAGTSTSGGPQYLDTPLTLTMANALGSPTNNELRFSSAINASVLAAPVPEPGTWAMLAGGLALLFVHARTRLRRQARARI